MDTQNSYAALPCTLSVADLQKALCISRASAYRLMNDPEFPSLRIGRRVLVPKDKFLLWIDAQIVKNNPEKNPKIVGYGDRYSA